ncbi:DNA polymerase [Planctomyces sp. SH-PL62]|uniref:DNA polymerase n=1 Tax=Planctomyces sp. SH-PL62 TaxID=1636152 RepID=UPI00078EA101|nr:DNA polymerase [Planctomyces sp. SH-PL62]AMV40451.1 DNA polymerase I, thermostable [Planctomyces sp. SH-PL62]
MPPGHGLDAYREVWLADFEFSAPPGERPTPVCLVAREFRSGRTIRLWQDDLRGRRLPPYPIGPDALFVAYFASAELGCHLALGWPLPARVLDLYAEFRNVANGLCPPNGFGLLGALMRYGLDAMDATEKGAMRELAIRGGPWTAEEREALLAYCESDVLALSKLLPRMLPELDLPRAVACRGRYMGAVATMEWAGVPIDTETLSRLREGWDSVQERLIRSVDSRFGVFDGRTFKAERWAGWLARSGVSWPRLESGELALDDDTFREMARSHPDVALMRELRISLSQLRLRELAVGSDGRNRTLLSPYRAKTGRNAPSNSRFIFGPSTWLRGLIKPGPGRAVAYLDWSQQEFGIAASLSGDEAMADAYRSGDPYLAFGKQAGRIPKVGTKQTHGADRELFKACVLGVQYGMGPEALARRIGKPTAYGRELLRLHRETYPAYWRWSGGAETHAMLLGRLHTVFGWTLHVGPDANPRSLRNYPCQANGAEMLRLACCLATDRSLPIIAPVHDAILAEGPAGSIEEIAAETQEAMAEASAVVLDGFRLRSDVKIVRSPERYMDDRGREFWGRVMALLPESREADRRPPVRACQAWLPLVRDPSGIAGGGRVGLQADPCGIATPA